MYSKFNSFRNNNVAIVTKIYKNSGDQINKGDILFDVETTKTSESIFSDVEGYIDVLCNEFEEYETNTVLAKIYDNKESYDNKDIIIDTEDVKINATQKAIEKAKELSVDLNLIQKDGVIKEIDVIDFVGKSKINKPVFQYDRERVIIIGAGMGADVVVDIMLDDSNKTIVGLVDDNVKEYTYIPLPVFNCSIMDFPDVIDRNLFDTVIISIVSNKQSLDFREKIFKEYSDKYIAFTNAIPKHIDIRRYVNIGVGNLICSNVYIGTGTSIGYNNFISYGCQIGHHNIIGNTNLIAPNVVTSGSVTIGDKCILAAGVTTMNRLSIGNNVIFPVGYSVIKDYEDNMVVKV
jgi:acetyltransferase-like isoleucine patch superfamily enzyme